MGKTCKEWIRKKLNTNITGSELEVRLPNGKVADWLFENDGNAVIIEDKESNDTSLDKAEIQLSNYYGAICHDYRNIVSIAVKETKNSKHKVKVFINGIEDKEHPKNNLNSLEYYFKLFSVEFNRQELIKNINELNQLMHQKNINDNIRASLCCTLLICVSRELELSLTDNISTIKQKVKEKLETFTIDHNGQDLNKWKKIEFLYKRFCSDIDTKISTITPKQIFEIFEFLKFKIWSYLKADNKNKSYDIMSLFFTTFGKKALSNDLGQYFTPDHISDLMTELLELNVNSKVLDLACGSGTFLAKCMDKMILQANNDEEKIAHIKQHQIFGIEKDPNVAGLAIANMLLHKDGKSNIIQDDCFKVINELKNKGIDRLILNPPYSKKPTELEFLKIGLDILNTGGIGVIIVPLSCAAGQKFREIRRELMESHTLKAIFTAPRELFYPVGTTTCIMVWQANIPHKGKTYLMDWKDDGFFKKRLSKGEATMVCDYKQWTSKRQLWLDDYFNKKQLGLFVEFDKETAAEMNWLYESHLQVDYTKLTEEDFMKVLRKYIAYKVENGIKE